MKNKNLSSYISIRTHQIHWQTGYNCVSCEKPEQLIYYHKRNAIAMHVDEGDTLKQDTPTTSGMFEL